MLKKLDIRNFTLIDHLEMALYPGFSVITGETGAGKSIVIGAIGLLLGNRADAKQVKRGCDKCIIEATFDLSIYHSDVLKDFFEDNDLDYEPEECLLRREVNANGKSRAFINDTPVTLAAKSLLRVHRPVVVAISTNDGLAASAQHIAALMARKDYYFVPYAQDDCLKKPLSLKADLSLLPETLEQAMRGRQFEPVLLT